MLFVYMEKNESLYSPCNHQKKIYIFDDYLRRKNMKNLINTSVFAVSLLLSGSVLAAGMNARGGFQGPGLEEVSVVEVLKMTDNTPVVLSGKIEKNIGDEKYLFSDGSATVVIEIDDDDWNGLNITPNDTVIISGEIDKDFMQDVIIDVDNIQLKK